MLHYFFIFFLWNLFDETKFYFFLILNTSRQFFWRQVTGNEITRVNWFYDFFLRSQLVFWKYRNNHKSVANISQTKLSQLPKFKTEMIFTTSTIIGIEDLWASYFLIFEMLSWHELPADPKRLKTGGREWSEAKGGGGDFCCLADFVWSISTTTAAISGPGNVHIWASLSLPF